MHCIRRSMWPSSTSNPDYHSQPRKLSTWNELLSDHRTSFQGVTSTNEISLSPSSPCEFILTELFRPSFSFFFFFNSILLKSLRNFVSSRLLKLVCENLTIASSGKLRMQLLSKRIRSSTRRASVSDAVRLRDLIYCEPRHYESSRGFVSVYDNFVCL